MRRPRGATDPGTGGAPAAAAVVALAGSVAVLAGGCSSGPSRTINASSAGNQISAQLASRYHVAPVPVRCPSGVGARSGRTFVCTASLDGQQVRMEATVTSGSGTFAVEPVEPILVPASVADQLGKRISARIGQAVTVTCPGGAVLVVPVHHSFTCQASLPGEAGRPVVVTVVDHQGNFGYQLAQPP